MPRPDLRAVLIRGIAVGVVLWATASRRAAATEQVLATPARPQTAIRSESELPENIWSTVTPTIAFVQREPSEGAAPNQRTEFRVVYTPTALYIKVHAFDTEPDRIVGYLTRRDETSPCDWIRVLIDSYHDRRTAYEFAVNPAGVKQDRYWFNDTQKDDAWDAVWDVSVARDPDGWSAEFRIPFSQLRFTPAPSNTFGFAVVREVARLNETSTWPLLARSATGYVSSFGELAGLSMIGSPKRLELMPFTRTDLTTQPTAGNPLLSPSAATGALGLDLKYALTPGLTLTSTINPDFGQVEADPAVVNLSAFETFFTERRPFFVEGSGIFQFGLDCPDCNNSLFYSRRVGRMPQGIGDLPSGDGVYTDAPLQTTIVGAAKLTGRVGQWSIGALEAATKEEFARVQSNGARFDVPVEPTTSYSVGRVRREFANQSSVGVMLTAASRHVPDALRFLPSSAYSGGIDWTLRFGRFYSIDGNVIETTLHGDPLAITRLQENSRHYFQRPDLTSATLDPTRTALGGSGGRFGFSKIGGQRLRFNSNWTFKSPGFDVDDLGFFRRADQRSMSHFVQLRSDVPTRWFRNRYVNVNQFAYWNYDGDRLDGSGGNVNGGVTFVNNWQVNAGLGVNEAAIDDRATRGGPALRTNQTRLMWSTITTSDRRRVLVSVFIGGGKDGFGSWFRDVNPDVTVRPIPSLTLATGIRFNRNVNDAQWVANVTDTRDHYVFAHLNQTTLGVTERVSYTVTPTLSLQLYAQPFVSSGGYNGMKELVAGRDPTYERRFAPFSYGANPDFNYKSFRTTNVLRWEYRPGSTLFVVWQQSREGSAPDGDFRFGRDLSGVFMLPPRNVLLVKLAYWLNF